MPAHARIRVRPTPDEIVRMKSEIARLERRLRSLDHDLEQRRLKQERFALEMALAGEIRHRRMEVRFDLMDRITGQIEVERSRTSAELRQVREALQESVA